jgi:hypothetical protein
MAACTARLASETHSRRNCSESAGRLGRCGNRAAKSRGPDERYIALRAGRGAPLFDGRWPRTLTECDLGERSVNPRRVGGLGSLRPDEAEPTITSLRTSRPATRVIAATQPLR